MTQEQKILRHLEVHHDITPVEAFKNYGILRLGARIWDLRNKGYEIKTIIEYGRNRFGEPTRFARYHMK